MTLLIQPVILSGGSGTRLWPLSREKYPKQLLPLIGEDSLLQAPCDVWTVLPVRSSLRPWWYATRNTVS